MYLKHRKTLETTLATESNYLTADLALPIHPACSLLINVIFHFLFLSNTHIYNAQSSNKYFLSILLNLPQSSLSMLF